MSLMLGLGGLNFKGFDYKGIGPYDGKVYLEKLFLHYYWIR